MSLEALSNDELLRLRRQLPDNSNERKDVCAEILRRGDDELMKDFLGHEVLLS